MFIYGHACSLATTKRHETIIRKEVALDILGSWKTGRGRTRHEDFYNIRQ